MQRKTEPRKESNVNVDYHLVVCGCAVLYSYCTSVPVTLS